MSGSDADRRKKREDERKESLDLLARIAHQSGGPPLPQPKAKPQPKAPAANPSPAAPRPRDAPRNAPLEGRAAEEADKQAWRARREREIAQAARLAGPRDTAQAPAAPADPEKAARARAARARAEERRMRRESLRELQEQRKQTLFRGSQLEQRGPWMQRPDMPAGVARAPRTPEPSLHAKIEGVLGEPGPSRQQRARERADKRRRGKS